MKTFADFGIDLRGRSGTEVKTTCPECSHTRKKRNYPCLNVNTEKAVWHCWHCEWSGSLKEGEERKANPRPWKPKTYHRPVFHNPLAPDAKALVWLRARGITEEVVKRAKIDAGTVYMPQVEEDVYAIQFPYFRDGECINIKYRQTDAKNFRMYGGAERILYGHDDIAETTIIVEGEVDKLSLAVAGHWNAVSVPDGAPSPNTKEYSSKFDYLDAAKDKLDSVKWFILAVDNDAPGQKLEEELARRLGRERCRRVIWPVGCKDANDVLLKHGKEALVACIDQAKPYPLAGVFEVLDLSDKVTAIYERGMPPAAPTGWRALEGLYSVRPGELTVITGIPSHGKSAFLDAMMINLARKEGWSFGVFSPENQPLEMHVSKLAETVVGKPFTQGHTERMNVDERDQAIAWLHQHVKFILPGEPSVECILSLAKALVFRYGIRGLVIDPWNEVEHSRPPELSETEYISRCLSRIRAFAREHAVHVWVVVHPTKLLKDKDGQYPVPTPYDCAGSAHWRNKSDNCLAVWREMDPDNRVVEIHIQKIRFKDVGQAGHKAELVFHRPTNRFYDEVRGRPK